MDLKAKPWWDFTQKDIKELLLESQVLLTKVKSWDQKFHDYSFIVFPAAKAYEGFLKNIFLDMGFIDKNDYYGKRFRIGKALNPHLDKDIRKKESVYDKLLDFCKGKNVPDKLWSTWKNSRNLLFHWFPEEKNAITLKGAEDRVAQIISAIDEVYSSCKIK